jgi:V8-like Glu-specific endopeptidase
LENHQAQVDEYVQIIQHPNGEEKQLAYRANIVVHSDTTYLQYLTDTLPGSSGSPVFNRDWKLVALHHAGGPPGGIVVGTGQFVRNQGIQVSLINQDLQTFGLL